MCRLCVSRGCDSVLGQGSTCLGCALGGSIHPVRLPSILEASWQSEHLKHEKQMQILKKLTIPSDKIYCNMRKFIFKDEGLCCYFVYTV